MKPTYQTRLTPPDGNCLAACLASIFEVPLSTVEFDVQADDWQEQMDDMLRREFCCGTVEFEAKDIKADLRGPRGWHLIEGKSPRGEHWHAIVGKDGKPHFDPSPIGDPQHPLDTMEIYRLFVLATRQENLWDLATVYRVRQKENTFRIL
ncbi:hypothetical protein GF373_17805 [bacterium]|nr:hypothetical protein [bacterium]